MTGVERAGQAVSPLVPPGPHFVHCYIYESEHCSCGGNYQGDRPGPELPLLAVEVDDPDSVPNPPYDPPAGQTWNEWMGR